MRLALAVVSLTFILVTLAASTFGTDAGGPSAESARGRTIWISGQVGREGARWGHGPEEQARLAFRNLEAELAREGSSLGDVVELTSYHRELGSLPIFERVLAEVLGGREVAWTAVEVTDLLDPASLVELKATAVVGASH